MADVKEEAKTPHGNGGSTFADKECDLMLAEYNTLRTELLQRLSTRYQLMSLTLTVFGTLIGITAFGSKAVYFVLLYPVLAFFLMNVYISNSHKMDKIKDYVKGIEKHVKQTHVSDAEIIFGWQTSYDTQHETEKDTQRTIGGRLIFPISATLALIFGLLIFFQEPGLNPAVTLGLLLFSALFCAFSWIIPFLEYPIFRI